MTEAQGCFPFPRGTVLGGPATRELPAISSRSVTFREDSTTSQATTTKRRESEEAGGEPRHPDPQLHCPGRGPGPEENVLLVATQPPRQAFPSEHTGLPPRAA